MAEQFMLGSWLSIIGIVLLVSMTLKLFHFKKRKTPKGLHKDNPIYTKSGFKAATLISIAVVFVLVLVKS